MKKKKKKLNSSLWLAIDYATVTSNSNISNAPSLRRMYVCVCVCNFFRFIIIFFVFVFTFSHFISFHFFFCAEFCAYQIFGDVAVLLLLFL